MVYQEEEKIFQRKKKIFQKKEFTYKKKKDAYSQKTEKLENSMFLQLLKDKKRKREEKNAVDETIIREIENLNKKWNLTAK